MTDATITRPERRITDEGLALLRAQFRGDLLQPTDAGYDDARRIWNAMHDKRPALIARPTGTADVRAVVDFARRGGWTPAIRGGGHGVPGHGVCEGDLMIDLSRMRSVRVDPVARVAHVQGGATWGDFDHEAQVFGLGVPGGAVSETGVGGLTLGGGYGWLTRKPGLTLDNLLSVEVVTADGAVRTASPQQHPDLFWAIRGGGGNFGVVTSFEFRLHDVGPLVLGGPIVWRFSDAPEVLRFYRDFGIDTPRELGINSVVVTIPEGPAFPEDLWGEKVFMVIVCWNGPHDRGEEVLRPLREFGAPVLDAVGPLPYEVQQSLMDAAGPGPFGNRQYWKTGYVEELTDEAIDAFLAGAARTTGLTMCELNTIDGAANDVDPAATACAKRVGRWNHVHVQCWTDAADDAANTAEAQRVGDEMAPHYAGGSYVNFLAVEDVSKIRSAYSEDGWERLGALKREHDPTNLFRRNQNIPPAEA